ncbi:MAG TPA: PHB depolymerase family esterase [Oculatellaceae cyanobacterium]
MDFQRSFDTFVKNLEQDYHTLQQWYHDKTSKNRARVEKFEVDHGLKTPPNPHPLPYIELHGDQTKMSIARPGDYSETITVDGRQRHFILHVPKGYDPSRQSQPIPLIVALHGFTQNAAEFQNEAGLDAYADAKHAAILYPDATQWLGIDIAAAWYTGNGLTPRGAKVDDVGFLRQAIGLAESQISVNKSRVDLLGVSNGGMMAYKAACEMSDTVAAVVDISGAMSGEEIRPKNPISVMSVVGTNDQIVPLAGRTKEQEEKAISDEMQDILNGVGSPRWKKFVESSRGKDLGLFIVEQSHFAPTFKPVSYATDFWKKTDGITGPPIEKKNGKVLTDDYQNPKTGVGVEQVVLTGMDHAALGGVPNNYKLNDEAWAFLEAHPKYYPPTKSAKDSHHIATKFRK